MSFNRIQKVIIVQRRQKLNCLPIKPPLKQDRKKYNPRIKPTDHTFRNYTEKINKKASTKY